MCSFGEILKGGYSARRLRAGLRPAIKLIPLYPSFLFIYYIYKLQSWLKTFSAVPNLSLLPENMKIIPLHHCDWFNILRKNSLLFTKFSGVLFVMSFVTTSYLVKLSFGANLEAKANVIILFLLVLLFLSVYATSLPTTTFATSLKFILLSNLTLSFLNPLSLLILFILFNKHSLTPLPPPHNNYSSLMKKNYYMILITTQTLPPPPLPPLLLPPLNLSTFTIFNLFTHKSTLNGWV